jgi:hypothetical protein
MTGRAARCLALRDEAKLGRPIAAADFLWFADLAIRGDLPPLRKVIRERDIDEMLLTAAGGLTGRPGARTAERKLQRYASTAYLRDREKSSPPQGPNGLLFLILEANGGKPLSSDRIRKRMGGLKIPLEITQQINDGAKHDETRQEPQDCNSRPPGLSDRGPA